MTILVLKEDILPYLSIISEKVNEPINCPT